MYTRDCRRGAARRRTALRCYGALTAPSVREVFLALDFPPGIITSRSVQIRDYSPDCRGDRTKSARACGTSTEEIFLTTRCHRVRPTEITDEDSERSSTPVTLQECAGGRSPPSPPPPPFLREHYRVGLNKQKRGKKMICTIGNIVGEKGVFEFGAKSHLENRKKRFRKKKDQIQFQSLHTTHSQQDRVLYLMIRGRQSRLSTSIEHKLVFDCG